MLCCCFEKMITITQLEAHNNALCPIGHAIPTTIYNGQANNALFNWALEHRLSPPAIEWSTPDPSVSHKCPKMNSVSSAQLSNGNAACLESQRERNCVAVGAYTPFPNDFPTLELCWKAPHFELPLHSFSPYPNRWKSQSLSTALASHSLSFQWCVDLRFASL